MTDRDWKPVRKGSIYCSPACGHNCTWSAYQEAGKKAAALAKRLGSAWLPDVWENLGWYYCAQHKSDCLRVHCHSHHRCSAYLGFSGHGAKWVGSGKTPEAAIDDVIQQVSRELHGIQQMLKLLTELGKQ